MRTSTIVTVAGLLVGITLGVGAYTFVYAKGYSYLTSDPKACANCHVMQSYFDGWVKSSHRNAAACNDCHAPHDLLPKYWTKAENGFFHSLAFTTGRFPDNIQIKARNHAVTEKACRSCHRDIVHSIDESKGAALSCVRCHSTVGHL